jgi:hypothetical protein
VLLRSCCALKDQTKAGGSAGQRVCSQPCRWHLACSLGWPDKWHLALRFLAASPACTGSAIRPPWRGLEVCGPSQRSCHTCSRKPRGQPFGPFLGSRGPWPWRSAGDGGSGPAGWPYQIPRCCCQGSGLCTHDWLQWLCGAGRASGPDRLSPGFRRRAAVQAAT